MIEKLLNENQSTQSAITFIKNIKYFGYYYSFANQKMCLMSKSLKCKKKNAFIAVFNDLYERA